MQPSSMTASSAEAPFPMLTPGRSRDARRRTPSESVAPGVKGSAAREPQLALQIGGGRSDVTPEGGERKAADNFPVGEETVEKIVAEIVFSRRNFVKKPFLKKIDAGADKIPVHLRPGGLFPEGDKRPLAVEGRKTEFGGRVASRKENGHRGVFSSVQSKGGRKLGFVLKISVPAENQKGARAVRGRAGDRVSRRGAFLPESLFGREQRVVGCLHTAGSAEGRILGEKINRQARRAGSAFQKVLYAPAQDVRKIARRDHGARTAESIQPEQKPAQQRHAGEGKKGLRTVGSKGSRRFPLPPARRKAVTPESGAEGEVLLSKSVILSPFGRESRPENGRFTNIFPYFGDFIRRSAVLFCKSTEKIPARLNAPETDGQYSFCNAKCVK